MLFDLLCVRRFVACLCQLDRRDGIRFHGRKCPPPSLGRRRLVIVCVILINLFISFFSLVHKVVSHGTADCRLLNSGDGPSQHW